VQTRVNATVKAPPFSISERFFTIIFAFTPASDNWPKTAASMLERAANPIQPHPFVATIRRQMHFWTYRREESVEGFENCILQARVE
jgi:hypothetical protein